MNSKKGNMTTPDQDRADLINRFQKAVEKAHGKTEKGQKSLKKALEKFSESDAEVIEAEITALQARVRPIYT